MSVSSSDPVVGVDVEDLRLGVKDAVRVAAEMQFQAIEIGAVSGDIAPRILTPSGRRHFRRFVDNFGVQLSALSADMPNLRLTDSRTVEQRVEQTCEILALARDLGVPVVTAGVGSLTHPQTGEPSPSAIDGLHRIGEFADRRGVRFAMRPSHDAGDRIVRVLDALRCPSIGLCLDPAAMVMAGANPLAAIERFVDQLVLVHARDGTSGLAARSGDEARAGRETSLGAGDVDLVGMLQALRDGEYHQPYILRRTESLNPRADLFADHQALMGLLRSR